MKTTTRRTAILVGIALTAACVGIAPATLAKSADAPATVATSADGPARSGQPHTVRVAGRQIPVDLANGLYKMRGSLVGNWQYIAKEVLTNKPTLYAEAGVEVFNGCIDRRPRDGSAPSATFPASCTWPSCTGRASTGTATSSRADASTPSQEARGPSRAHAAGST